MTQRILVASGACVFSMIVWLMYQVRAEPEPVKTVPGSQVVTAEVDQAPAPQPAPQARPMPRRRAQRPAPVVVARVEPADQTTVSDIAILEDAIELTLHNTVPQIVLSQAAQCYRGEPGRRERMMVEYDVVVSNGQASLRNVRQLSSNFEDGAQLERCIIDRLTGLTWEDPEAPDIRRQIQFAITIRALRKRAVRDDPEQESGPD